MVKSHQILITMTSYPDYDFPFTAAGIQYIYRFDNGIKVSVILSRYSYGGEKGYFEIGVFNHGEMWYNNPITGSDSVMGWLTWEQVQEKLKECDEYGQNTIN